jgi:hypothetical protein
LLPYSLHVATEEPAPSPAEPSSWSRLPALDGEGGASAREKERAREREKDRAGSASVAAPSRAAGFMSGAASVGAAIRGGAETVSLHFGEGLGRAKAALDGASGPGAPELEALYTSADLPQLSASDPLGSLAVRLDREADLWRSLAMRALTRAAWADRITQGAGVLVGIGALGLAVIAGLGVLFGASAGLDRLLLLGGALTSLAVGAALVTWISGNMRRGQRDLAREVMLRADMAELRLHRVGVVTALLQMDPEAGRQSVARLERDVSAPPR